MHTRPVGEEASEALLTKAHPVYRPSALAVASSSCSGEIGAEALEAGHCQCFLPLSPFPPATFRSEHCFLAALAGRLRLHFL